MSQDPMGVRDKLGLRCLDGMMGLSLYEPLSQTVADRGRRRKPPWNAVIDGKEEVRGFEKLRGGLADASRSSTEAGAGGPSV